MQMAKPVAAGQRFRWCVMSLAPQCLALDTEGLDIEVSLLHARVRCEGRGRLPLGRISSIILSTCSSDSLLVFGHSMDPDHGMK